MACLLQGRAGVGARRRILERGAGALSEAELLGLLLQCRCAPGAGDELATRLLAHGLGPLSRRPPVEEPMIDLSEEQALRVCAALELGRRLAQPSGPGLRLGDGRALCSAIGPRLLHLPHEEFWALILTPRLELVHEALVARGGLTQCSILPREAFAPAMVYAAPCIAFAHNHPSGDPSPSAHDHRLQILLDEAGETLGIRVVDHVVIGRDGHHSAREGYVSLRPPSRRRWRGRDRTPGTPALEVEP